MNTTINFPHAPTEFPFYTMGKTYSSDTDLPSQSEAACLDIALLLLFPTLPALSQTGNLQTDTGKGTDFIWFLKLLCYTAKNKRSKLVQAYTEVDDDSLAEQLALAVQHGTHAPLVSNFLRKIYELPKQIQTLGHFWIYLKHTIDFDSQPTPKLPRSKTRLSA